MNERIRLLWRQAVLNNTKTPMNFQDAADEFARLIVEECILTIQMGITRDGPNTEKYLRSMKHLKDIKEHFGVEE